MAASCPWLWRHMADQVYIVVQVSSKLIVDASDGAARVPDELPLRHFVFDMRTCQVDGQHYQRETDDVDSICRRPQASRQSVCWVTIRYDSVYLTCSKKLTDSQLNLPHKMSL